MSFYSQKVSIIIATACEAARSQTLKRSIESVFNQTGIDIELIVVVNGNKYDSKLLSYLENDCRLCLIKIELGNVSAARYEGLLQSSGDFFGFLDDDDEYIPGAIAKRLDIFRRCDSIDIVVTNGYESSSGVESALVYIDEEEINKDPALSFLRQNWFASPASLFRRSSVDKATFNIDYKYFEWSYLFFLLVSQGKVFCYDNNLTYRVHADTAQSASKSLAYDLAYPDFLKLVCRLSLSPRVIRVLDEKYIIALNASSNCYLNSGKRLLAWKMHFKCLLNGGWRYFPYTFKLIFK